MSNTVIQVAGMYQQKNALTTQASKEIATQKKKYPVAFARQLCLLDANIADKLFNKLMSPESTAGKKCRCVVEYETGRYLLVGFRWPEKNPVIIKVHYSSEPLGKGSYGKVYESSVLARVGSSWDIAEGVECNRVMKIQEESDSAQTEAQFMTRQLGSLASGVWCNRRYMDQIRLPGNCLTSFFTKQNWSLTERFACATAMIQTAINYHVGGLAHSDIKPDNMVYDSNNNEIGFIDNAHVGDLENPEYRLPGDHGTAGFVAPEQYLSKIVSEKTMVFSLGITLLNIFSKFPSQYNVAHSTVTKISKGNPPVGCVTVQHEKFMPEFKKRHSDNVEQFKSFLLTMVSYEAGRRPTLQKCLTSITAFTSSYDSIIQSDQLVMGAKRDAEELKRIKNEFEVFKIAAIEELQSHQRQLERVNSEPDAEDVVEHKKYLVKAAKMKGNKLAKVMGNLSRDLKEIVDKLKKIATNCDGVDKRQFPDKLEDCLESLPSYQVKIQVLNDLAVFIYCNSPDDCGIKHYNHKSFFRRFSAGRRHTIDFTATQSVHMKAVVSEAKNLASEMLNSDVSEIRERACHFLHGSLAATVQDSADLSVSCGWGGKLLASTAESGQWYFAEFAEFAKEAEAVLSKHFQDGRNGISSNSKSPTPFMKELEQMSEGDAVNALFNKMKCYNPLCQLIALEVEFLSILARKDAYTRGDHDTVTTVVVSIRDAIAGPSDIRKDIIQGSATKMKHIRLLQAAYSVVLDRFGQQPLVAAVVEQVSMSYLVKCCPVQYQQELDGYSCVLKLKAESLLEAPQNIEALKSHYREAYTASFESR